MKTVLAVASSLWLVFSSHSAQADQNKDVNDCEIYVDDFSVVSAGSYGSGIENIVANLVMRSDLNAQVVAVAGFFNFSGKYTTFSKAPDGTEKSEVVTTLNEQSFQSGERTIDGQNLRVVFPISWTNAGFDMATRSVSNFTYKVTVRDPSDQVTHFWLKNAGRDFSSDDISKDKYYYSQGVYLGGYSTARYLWRDSGSPLFANRARCLGR
jgi:hypothetical protein